MRSMVLSFTLVSALSAGVYDYGYNTLKEVSIAEKNNPLYYGDFERIMRYNAIGYTPSDPVRINQKQIQLDKMYQSIESYVKANVPYKVSVIGHTRCDKESDHESAQENTFFGSLHNAIMESDSDAETNRVDCIRAVEMIKKELMNHKIPEENILGECRDGSQPLYLENDEDARENNYRVMVSLYTEKVQKQQPAHKAVPVAATKSASVAVAAPAESDTDSDGVLDSKDTCPKTPAGYRVDENGCPMEVTLHIKYKTASAIIPQSSYKQIDDLKRFMSDFPEYTIEIIGHTDDVGSEASNEALSLKRAKSLEAMVIQGGISAERIKAIGMGERSPVASNSDEDGRAQNRRTEVKMHKNSLN